MTEVTTEMPRSRSIFIQSERVLRRSPLALTWPARLMAPPNSNNFSVSVVLPASGCEMMAKVRRRAASVAMVVCIGSIVRLEARLHEQHVSARVVTIEETRDLGGPEVAREPTE